MNRLGKKVAFCLSPFLSGVLLESIWYVFKMPTCGTATTKEVDRTQFLLDIII